MNNRNSEDVLFDACASCTVIAIGAAFAVLFYHLFTLAVSLLESTMRSADFALRAQ